MNTNSHYKEYSKYILEEFQLMKTLKMILLLKMKSVSRTHGKIYI
jgi:hypothetical protein